MLFLYGDCNRYWFFNSFSRVRFLGLVASQCFVVTVFIVINIKAVLVHALPTVNRTE